MMLTTTSFGPGLTAEIAYRRERNLVAAQGESRGRRSRSRRVAPVRARRTSGWVSALHAAR